MSSVSQQIRATSLNRALTVLGDWWTVLIVREAFLGSRLFDTFQARLDIPRQTLHNRLRELITHGVLHTRPYQYRPLRHEYRLTPKGLDLYPYALLLWSWQRKWGQNSVNPLPGRLVHRACGQAMEPVFVCGHCREPVLIRDVDYCDGPGAGLEDRAPPRLKRSTVTKAVLSDPRLYQHNAFIASDRWTHLILASVYLGCNTFEALRGELGIATNILAQRLNWLVDSLMLRKLPDPADGRRYQYRLTERSRDLFPITMALVRWADSWMPHPAGPPMLRFHRTCGHRLDPLVVCSACGEALYPRDVRPEYVGGSRAQEPVGEFQAS